ncbi:hypothetical protein Enr8_49600 [Blastopirellula retiformator]|uniref:Uncharacterized protein n=1 Tax=Blastopirellula retiformator TaxID=2527970 RepID=A0A5C5UST4_9BACT|nr:hypothetical protein Enr8_49600 [Blastopirellula retiformator]
MCQKRKWKIHLHWQHAAPASIAARDDAGVMNSNFERHEGESEAFERVGQMAKAGSPAGWCNRGIYKIFRVFLFACKSTRLDLNRKRYFA